MLFIDHGQGQVGEVDAGLEQRVGADRDVDLATGDARQAVLLGLAFGRGGDPGDLHAERFQPFVHFQIELFGQNFGRRHHRHLAARRQRRQQGERRDQRLAAADIALQQTVHRMRPRQVAMNFLQCPALRAGQREGQGGEQLLGKSAIATQWHGIQLLTLARGQTQ